MARLRPQKRKGKRRNDEEPMIHNVTSHSYHAQPHAGTDTSNTHYLRPRSLASYHSFVLFALSCASENTAVPRLEH